MRSCLLCWAKYILFLGLRELGRHTTRPNEVHGGKTHVWNRAGRKLEACDAL